MVMHINREAVFVNMLQLGCAIGFWIPPIIVPSSNNLDEIGYYLGLMLYGTAGVTTVLFLLVLACEYTDTLTKSIEETYAKHNNVYK